MTASTTVDFGPKRLFGEVGEPPVKRDFEYLPGLSLPAKGNLPITRLHGHNYVASSISDQAVPGFLPLSVKILFLIGRRQSNSL